jgi:hypothetical protein
LSFLSLPYSRPVEGGAPAAPKLAMGPPLPDGRSGGRRGPFPRGIGVGVPTKGDITQSDEDMAAEILHGTTVLETRPGEDAVVVIELRRQAG